MTESPKNPWDRHWGRAYDPETKRDFATAIFKKLEKGGKIGNVIVDVGSGAHPIASLLDTKRGRKLIAVDVVSSNQRMWNEQRINFDAEKIKDENAASYKKALIRVSDFLGIDPRREADKRHADTILFSELLNYVDYKEVVEGFSQYLKPDGRIIIINMPSRGIKPLFSEKGLKDNTELYSFLEDHNFKIEEKAFPWRVKEPGKVNEDESEEMIVLVASKKPADTSKETG